MNTIDDLALLYIGAFAPDSPEYRNGATSVAGSLIQHNIFSQLSKWGLPEPTVHAYLPVPSFPKGKGLVHFSKRIRYGDGKSMRSLGHINLGPLKILTLGITAAIAALRWGWKNRHARRRVAMCYNLTAPPIAFLLPVCRLLDIELVPYIGDICVPGETVPDSWSRRVEYSLQSLVLPRAAGMVVCNHSIVEDFAPGTQALLMDGGIPSSFLSQFEAPRESRGQGFTALFAGELDDLEGVTMLLEAVDQLPRMKDLRVRIFGRGKYEPQVREAANRDPRISYHGFVPYDDLMRAYAEADLLLVLRSTTMRTQRYFFPFKFIECLATGTPVLTTCTGHVEREFGDFAYLLSDESPAGLARRIREIAESDPADRAAIGVAARRFVAENRTWDVQGRRVSEYIRELEFQEAA